MKKQFKKTKSILFGVQLPPPIHGASTMNAIVQKRFESQNNKFVDIGLTNKIDDYEKFKLYKPFKFVLSILMFLNYLRNSDIIYLTPSTSPIGFLKDSIYVIFGKFFRKKIFLHFHSKGLDNIKSTILIRYIIWILKDLQIIILSENLRYDLSKFKIKEPYIHICPNGLGIEKEIRKKNFERPNILYLSNLIPSKGYFKTLEICKHLNELNIDFKCNFVGKGSESEIKNLKSYIKNNHLEEKVFYHGAKYHEEKEIFFQSSNIFVFPSRYKRECFPLVLIEALSYGLVCITSNEGAINTLLNGNGIVIDKESKFSYNDAIISVISNVEAWKNLSDSSIDYYNQFLTEDRFFERLNKILI